GIYPDGTSAPIQGSMDQTQVWGRELSGVDIAAVASTFTTAPPTVSVTAPTSGATYSATVTPLSPALGGAATDDVGVVSVTWSCPGCQASTQSGTATCTPACGATATSVTWSVPTIALQAGGGNVITVTATDGEGQTAVKTLTVTLTGVPVLRY